MNKIYLVGYMGAGKTTAARRLAQRLGWEVADTDDLFEVTSTPSGVFTYNTGNPV